jgi:hypothetical protein
LLASGVWGEEYEDPEAEASSQIIGDNKGIGDNSTLLGVDRPVDNSTLLGVDRPLVELEPVLEV